MNKLSYDIDALIVGTICNDSLSKISSTDSIVSSVVSKVTSYFDQHVDKSNKAASFLNLIAPGAITLGFKAMGLGGIGTLIGLAASVFHIDFASIFASIYGKIKSLLFSKKPITPDMVDSLVSDSMSPASGNDEEVQPAMTKLEMLDSAPLIKASLMLYEAELNTIFFVKTAAYSRVKSISLITTILSWFFKAALSAAGLMVVGDMINKFVGRPNALDGNLKSGPAPTTSTFTSKQTKFKVNPSYQDSAKENWAEDVSNSSSGITNMLLNFAKQVYSGLENADSTIINSPNFIKVRDYIENYNHSAAGDPIVFIPKYFRTKKQIVDCFIDQVAEKAS